MKNEILKNYVVRKLDEVALAEKHVKLYIVLEKNRYIATVKVNLISSNHAFEIIDSSVRIDSKDEIVRKDKGYYYKTSLAIEAVATYVLEPIMKQCKAVEFPYY